MKKWREWFGEKKWRNLKKSDWIVLGLAGVLLLVIAAPMERASTSRSGTSGSGTDYLWESGAGEEHGTAYQENSRFGNSADSRDSGTSGGGAGGAGGYDGTSAVWDPADYAAYLEERLAGVLSQMDGVGEVEVMITIADAGELVVEKDRTGQSSVTEESDSAGGSRTVSQTQSEEQAIRVENGQETRPYVQKEKLPTITGVVIVAEGGGSPSVISEISDAVLALLPVEVHRIKVVKMCSKEEST